MFKKIKTKPWNMKLGEYLVEVRRVFNINGYNNIKIDKELIVLARRCKVPPVILVRCIWHNTNYKVKNPRFAQLVDIAHRNFEKKRG